MADQLGTPRMVLDQAGSLAGMARHDYLPFGEELTAGVGGRLTAQGYGAADDLRQQFTGYERDAETGIDYAQARYFASAQGRFTGVDPLLASAHPGAPQTWNRYAYALNNPLRLADPTGMTPQDGFTANNPCAMGEVGCHPINMGTVTVTGTSESVIPQEVATVAETLFEFVKGVPAGAAGALSFGTVGGAQPTDSLSNRLGQVVGNVAVGVAGYDLAAGGTSVTVASGGTTAAVSVPTAVVGVAGMAGAVTNAVKIVTTPMQSSNNSGSSSPATEPYKRPSGATTPEQRASVQGKPCVDCGQVAPRMNADHIDPLVVEYYRTGTIDKTRMRSVNAVQPQCPTCSNQQGGFLSNFSRQMRQLLGF